MGNEKVQKLYCQFCGKRLPANILELKGEIALSVVCPHCKNKNTVERKDIR